MAGQARSSHLWVLLAALLVLIIGPFLVWGGWFEKMLDLHGAKAWMEALGPWSWLGGITLLVADLVLPIPGTVVMSALGLVHGWFWGGLVSSLGSVLGGLVAYGLCRKFGRGAALWLAGGEGLARAEVLFRSQRGGWLVALSRWMPVLPEAVACLAGLTAMPFRVFFVALLCGGMPLGFTFAAIGALGVERPGLAVALSALVPVVLYALVAWLMRKR